jgi:hypothetical protein
MAKETSGMARSLAADTIQGQAASAKREKTCDSVPALPDFILQHYIDLLN